jgi:hypothetical protein
VLLSRGGQSQPDLALELDRDGEVIAKQVLTLHRVDDDGLEDFSDEEPLAYVDAFSEGARQAPRCECPDGYADGGTCGRCGHDLPEAVAEAA